MINLVFFVLVTVVFSLPVATSSDDGNREEPYKRSINVYSVRQGDRIWSMMDLCHIEIAARENPELNINLINLHREKLEEDSRKDLVTPRSEPETKIISNAIDSRSKAAKSLRMTREALIRDQLARKYENVKSHDIVVDNFFQGTNLSRIVGNLNDGVLKMATEAYLIWNSSGIALNPKLYCNLKYISQMMCVKENKDCIPDELATVDPRNDIQAAGIPCQAFLGYFINDISKNESVHKEEALSNTINKFCPKSQRCNEVRILKQVQTCPLDTSKCPVVYHRGILLSLLGYNYPLSKF